MSTLILFFFGASLAVAVYLISKRILSPISNTLLYARAASVGIAILTYGLFGHLLKNAWETLPLYSDAVWIIGGLFFITGTSALIDEKFKEQT
ncbi:hypothetical protein A3L11_08620 [Thermococcus siculi]|uniref:Uncharacterized protein n=1 Tax=Thermococcus siculi TaxID=72803 RepID=A0A2Z2MN81_9EURY|nr:hypothetical protein [Thermococcus siculi]ASJ09288.1 hypothetical protein A3L11_08620 [Thermococcus siculi]